MKNIWGKDINLGDCILDFISNARLIDSYSVSAHKLGGPKGIAGLYFSPLVKEIYDTIKKLQTYIPYYELVMPPVINDDILVLSIKVKGSGDYLPEYAGNLDIINCAAIEITKYLDE